MNAQERLQEFRYKKLLESTAARKSISSTKPTSTPSSSSPASSSSPSSISSNTSRPLQNNTTSQNKNGNSNTLKNNNTIRNFISSSNHGGNNLTKKSTVNPIDISDIDSESDADLRSGVKKMSTSSPRRGSSPLDQKISNGSSKSPPSLQKSFSSTSTSSSSSFPTQGKAGFRDLVTSFRYTGKDALAPPSAIIDSDRSITDPELSDCDVVMLDEPPKSTSKNTNSHLNPVKRQIITSDEDDVEEIKPRRRLMKRTDIIQGTNSDIPKRRRLVKRVALDSDSDNEGQSTRSGSASIRISDDDAKNKSNGHLDQSAINTISIDSSSSLSDASLSPSPVNSPKETHTYNTSQSSTVTQTSRLHKLPSATPTKKKISVHSSDDSDDSFGDDNGPNQYKAQDRKEERALQFFNESTMLELQELSGCSKTQAIGVIGLRPFNNYDHLCVSLRKTKGVGEKIVNSYLTTTDAIRAVDMVLKTVDRVREDLAGILGVWCGQENGALFGKANSVENRSAKEIKQDSGDNSVQEKGDDKEADKDDEEPGMDLVEIDAEKLEQTEKGRLAMKGFLRSQPSNMAPTFQLKGYQLLGVNWLALLWRKKLSGILADEMGLGKTAQVIAFLAHLLEQGEEGPFLIIVPSSVLDNWLREFENFCPQLDVRSYYGSQAEREELRYQLQEDPTYNVIVTTYTIATGNNDERKFLNKRRFKGVVLDEGHMVKNCTSARYKQLMSIKTPFRLLLTGTPLQNNLEELLSLLIFIMPDLFSEHEEVLRTMFKVKVDASSEKSTLLSQERIVRARHLLAPFVLRRKKIHVINMPRKIQSVIYCDLHPDQRALYDRLMSSSELRAALGEDDSDAELDPIELDGLDAKAKSKALKKGTAKKTAALNKSSRDRFANMLMQLRKAADHPMLFRELYTDDVIKKMSKVITKEIEFCDSNIAYIEEDMSVMTDFEIHRMCNQYKSIKKFALPGDQWMHAGKVKELERLLPDLVHKQKSRVLIFSQFTMVLDILESILKTMDLSFIRMDGQTKVEERQPLIDSFNQDDTYKIFLLSTKAGGFGINLTGANVVIMYDLDFNPHNDKQAEDRAHRVGQTRDVEVIKLISKGTIEEQIYQLANLKLKLDQHVSQDDSAKASSSESSSSSSTPSAGILSLIKQTWKATHSGANASEKRIGVDYYERKRKEEENAVEVL